MATPYMSLGNLPAKGKSMEQKPNFIIVLADDMGYNQYEGRASYVYS